MIPDDFNHDRKAARIARGGDSRQLRLMRPGSLPSGLRVSEVLRRRKPDKAFHLLEEKPDQHRRVPVKNTVEGRV